MVGFYLFAINAYLTIFFLPYYFPQWMESMFQSQTFGADPMLLYTELHNKPKFQQDLVVDSSKGMPPIDLKSKYWG